MIDARYYDLAVFANLEKQLGAQTFAEIIGAFLEHVPDKMNSVREGGRSGDLEMASRALHSIRSSAGMLGASALFEAANDMERLARSGDRTGLVKLLDGLEEMYSLSEAFLREQFARMTSNDR